MFCKHSHDSIFVFLLKKHPGWPFGGATFLEEKEISMKQTLSKVHMFQKEGPFFSIYFWQNKLCEMESHPGNSNFLP